MGQRKRHLEQIRDSSRALRVPYAALDRGADQRHRAADPQRALERAHLDRISQRGACAMALGDFDRIPAHGSLP